MRILIPVAFLPYPPDTGARIRTWEIARRLLREHDVTFALHLRNPAWEKPILDAIRDHGFQILAGRVDSLPRALPRALGDLANGTPPVVGLRRSRELERAAGWVHAKKPFDVIQAEHLDVAGFPFLLPRQSGTIFSLTLHDLLSVSYPRIGELATSRFNRFWFRCNATGMGGFEREILPRYDLRITMSTHDQKLIAPFTRPDRNVVLPNAVDTNAKQVLPEPRNAAPVILLVGYMLYPPNHDAAAWLITEVLPVLRRRYPQAKLLIVGGHPPATLERLAAKAGPNVELVGHVPDVEPWYRQADIAIVPLRAGGGTRLKILEAMAFGRPVVSTRLGAEGIEAEDGRHLLLADDAEGLAAHVQSLFEQPRLREKLRNEGRALVEARYCWEECGNRHLEIYERLDRERRSG